MNRIKELSIHFHFATIDPKRHSNQQHHLPVLGSRIIFSCPSPCSRSLVPPSPLELRQAELAFYTCCICPKSDSTSYDFYTKQYDPFLSRILEQLLRKRHSDENLVACLITLKFLAIWSSQAGPKSPQKRISTRCDSLGT